MPPRIQSVFGLLPNQILLPRPPELGNTIRRAWNYASSHGIQQKCMHHSAQLQRFYTNRFHKKECPRCSRPNIVPARRCGYCDLPLTDLDIRLVGRDVFRDLVAARIPNHTQGCSSYCVSSDQAVKRDERAAALGSDRSLGSTTGPGQRAACAAAAREIPVSRLEEEVYRCFDFLVIKHPYPVGALHLSAIPKGTMYDIKQLRRAHLPLLKRMQQSVMHFVPKLIDKVVDEDGWSNWMSPANRKDCGASPVQSQGELTPLHDLGEQERTPPVYDSIRLSDDPHSSKRHKMAARRLMENSVIFGFSYPCGFLQLNMHAVVPPIRNFNMFEAPYFFPLKKVIQDLQSYGAVHPYEQHRAPSRFGCDGILKEIRQVDDAVRRALLDVACFPLDRPQHP